MDESRESMVERKIREAQERGAFDDLPGRGEPLRGLHVADDENWWIRGFVERHGLQNDALLPTPLRLRKEVERLPATVRDLPTEDAVRDVVRALNERIAAYIRTPTGPQVAVRPASADAVVARWRADREDARAAGRLPHRPGRPAAGSDRASGDGSAYGPGQGSAADERRRRLRRWWFLRDR